MRIMIIANPNAGGFKRVSIQRIEKYLTEKGADVTISLTKKKGHAKDIAAGIKEGEYDIVAAAGGDGTVNEVINGLATRNIILGVIPLGTVNVFALETNIPFDPFKACDIILDGRTEKINLGMVNERYFILMVSAGFDAQVAYKIHTGLKSKLGMVAYLLQGIFMLFDYKFPKIRVTADNESCTGYTVIVSNMRLYAGKITITPDASFLKDDFEVCVLTRKGFVAVIKFLFYVLFRRHHLFKAVTFLRAKEIVLESDNPCYIQADGDGIGSLPKKITLAKDALTVVIPK